MSQKTQHTDPEIQIEQAINNTENFIVRNGQKLITLLVVATIAVGGYFAYQALVVGPKIQQATTEMLAAQQQFEADSLAIALNGIDGVFLGFADIATEFSGTPQANIANHYAGICTMGLGDFNAALQYLQAFSQFSKSDAAGQIINAQNLGLQGDCHSELGDTTAAIDLYKKAAAACQSDATTPLYLQKQAIALYTQGQLQQAAQLFQQIKTQYPNSLQNRDADKHLALINQQL